MTTILSYVMRGEVCIGTEDNIEFLADLYTPGNIKLVCEEVTSFTTDHSTYDTATVFGEYWLEHLILMQKTEIQVEEYNAAVSANAAKWKAICEEESNEKKKPFVDIGMSYSTRAMKKRVAELLG